MAYLAKLSPRAQVPSFINILSKCGFRVTESPENVVLIPSGNGKVLKIDNDSVGSGKDAVQVAAVQFASKRDDIPYLLDFNVEKRRSKIEKHSEGSVKYEDYLSVIQGRVSDREFKETEALDEEGEVIIKPEFDALIKGIHHPDTAQEIYEVFKDTGFGFCIKILKKKTIEFASPGFSVKNIENSYTFTPMVEMEYVKGPEDDQLVEYIIDYLENNSLIESGEILGESDNKLHIIERKEVVSSNQSSPIEREFKTDHSEEQKRLLVGVTDEVLKKYIRVKFDFEEKRDNLQINKDDYFKLQDREFKVTPNLRKLITDMKLELKGCSFARMVSMGTDIIGNYTNTQAYMQSVLARSTKSYAGKERHVYLSLFLDMLIRSPAQFPKMHIDTDGVFKFDSGFSDNKSENLEDPYEKRRTMELSRLERMRRIEQLGRNETWPTLDEQKREFVEKFAGYSQEQAFLKERKVAGDETINI